MSFQDHFRFFDPVWQCRLLGKVRLDHSRPPNLYVRVIGRLVGIHQMPNLQSILVLNYNLYRCISNINCYVLEGGVKKNTKKFGKNSLMGVGGKNQK